MKIKNKETSRTTKIKIDLEKEEAKNNKNYNFTQLYDLGKRNIRAMFKNKEYFLGDLYMYLIENCETSLSTIRISQKDLCKILNCNIKTLRKNLKILQQRGCISITEIIGEEYLYSINPDEIWNSKSYLKEHSPYYTNMKLDKIADIEFIKDIRKASRKYNKTIKNKLLVKGNKENE